MDLAMTSRPKPSLQELGFDLLRLPTWRTAWVLLLPFLAFGGYWACASAGYWIPAALSLVVLSFVTYGSTSHDLVHGSLGLPRRLNDVLLSLIEAIALRSGHAYQRAHLHHHARFPAEDDVEAKAARMSLWRTLLDGVVFQVRIFRWALRHPGESLGWIRTEGVLVLGILIAALSALPWTPAPAVYVGLMIAGSWIIPLITVYLPHDVSQVDPVRQTRLFRGTLARLLAFDHLYHLEHHLYPGVPHPHWPALARRLDSWLAAQGVRPSSLLDPRKAGAATSP
jgi:beta-carotene hydroxylase